MLMKILKRVIVIMNQMKNLKSHPHHQVHLMKRMMKMNWNFSENMLKLRKSVRKNKGKENFKKWKN